MIKALNSGGVGGTSPFATERRTERFKNLLEPTTTQVGLNKSFQVALNSSSVIKNIAKDYDVSHMSDRQMKDLATQLKDAKLISEWEYCDMTLVIKPIGGNYDPDIPKNFLLQYQSQIEFSKKYSTQQDTKMLEHITDLLSQIAKA